MPIAREGRFLITRDLAHTPCLGIESAMLGACIEEVHARQLKGVFGSPGFGFLEVTLDTLHDLPDLEAIWFWDIELENIDALYGLSSLQFFGVHPKRPAIDFARLPSLRHIVWTHKPTDSGLRSLRLLDNLHVWYYLPKSKSFSDLLLPERLTELQINWANPSTLEGLASIPSLRHLEIHRCRNLESLALLPTLFPKLERLVVSACGRIPEGEGERIAAQIPTLRHAVVGAVKIA